jgi:hypothetical protein
LLYHALGLTPQNVKEANLVTKYLGLSLTDPQLQAICADVDDMLGLPRGTIHPAGLKPVYVSDCVVDRNELKPDWRMRAEARHPIL